MPHVKISWQSFKIYIYISGSGHSHRSAVSQSSVKNQGGSLLKYPTLSSSIHWLWSYHNRPPTIHWLWSHYNRPSTIIQKLGIKLRSPKVFMIFTWKFTRNARCLQPKNNLMFEVQQIGWWPIVTAHFSAQHRLQNCTLNNRQRHWHRANLNKCTVMKSHPTSFHCIKCIK